MARNRNQIARTVLSLFASTASTVALTGEVQRDELFRKYDAKLSSYGNDLVRFALATIPAVVAMTIIFIAYRTLESLKFDPPSRRSVLDGR